MPKNCKISTEMLQKLLNFYISAECKHMHQVRDNQHKQQFTKKPLNKRVNIWYPKNSEHGLNRLAHKKASKQHKNMKLKVTRFSIFLEIELEQIKFKSSPWRVWKRNQ